MKLTYAPMAAVILATLHFSSAAVPATEPSVESMPPSVVKTVPQAGETDVDPSLRRISVTFSKDMMTNGMWSWCRESVETFPEAEADHVRYLADRRTCVLPVRLAPNRTYAIWINSTTLQRFRDMTGLPAVPYLLVFRTGTGTPATVRAAEEAAETAASSWLKLVDAGEYGKSWDDAAAYFKDAVSRDTWERRITAVRRPLGKNLSRERASATYLTSLPGAPDGEYVVIRFLSSFENKKSAVETVTPMRDEDGEWRVSGYYIR